MRFTLLFVTISLMLLSTAMADCASEGYSTPLSGIEINTALNNKRVNANNPSTSENWKEDHCLTGDLYKVGAGTSVDPYRKIGTYDITGGASVGIITYNYDGGGSYAFTVFSNSGTGLCWELSNKAEAIQTASPGGAGDCSTTPP